jgi:uncharacterized protein (DUF1501 family)
MYRLGALRERTCSGVQRREVLQVGGVGALGLSLARAARAESERRRGGELSVLTVFLRGGVSHLDTWDMKPESASADVRGELKAIESSVPGLRFCELLPRLAEQAGHLSLLRGASHREGEHDRAMQWVLTGHPASAGQVFPNPGAVLSRYSPGRPPLPSAIHVQTLGLGTPQAPPALPSQPGLGAGFMPAAYQPFMLTDVEKLGETDWLNPGPIAAERIDRRHGLLSGLDRLQRQIESVDGPSFDVAYERAFALVTSASAKRAFRIEEEPSALRDRYGRHEFGQSCLLARRLIEAGVRYVQVNWSARGWQAITPKCDLFTRSTYDSHFGHFPWLRRQLPRLDDGLPTLLADLHDRGLLRNTLVLVLTEFGRTAKINGDAGRDHWQPAFTVLAAGAGLPGGRAVGATDSSGMEVTDGKFEPHQLLNSVYELCGLDVPVTLRQAGLVPKDSAGVPGLIV